MNKETTAMARARELNRTNEKRLSACIETMSKDVEKNLQKLKIEGESTIKFMKKLRRCSGNSEVSGNFFKVLVKNSFQFIFGSDRPVLLM